MTKFQKRMNIILVYLLLAVAFVGVIYFTIRPETTCTDGIKNQGEEKADCGGPCSPCRKKIHFKELRVISVERVGDGKGNEDILIEIHNPNEEYGAESFEYEIYDGITDGGYRYKGKDFVLPMETKYIIINKYSGNKDGKLNIRIDENKIIWKRIINFRDPNLVVYNNEYSLKTSGSVYSDLTGLLVNKSAVDYETIKVKGVLRSAKGKLIAAGYQVINTLPAGNKREFHILFPIQFSDREVVKEIQVETNIFSSENYLKTRGRQNNIDQ
jgi:hypothetical protein